MTSRAWWSGILFVVSSAAQAGPSASESIPVRIDNPAKAERTQIVRLEELWRVGEDNEGIVFGEIGGMVVDGEGRLYVIDRQARRVSVFSPEGEFLRSLGREGEGPGEFREPAGLVVLPDGFVGIVRDQPPAILRFRASDGQFVDDFYLAEDPKHPFQRLSRVVCRGRTLVVYGSDIRQSADGMGMIARLMRFDASGKFLGECERMESQFQFANPVIRERYDIVWQVGPDERLFINNKLEYEFDVRAPDCKVERVISRQYERRKRTSAEADSVRAYYSRVGNIGDAKVELFDHVRDIAWFSVDDDGRLWVLSSRGRLDLPSDSLGYFDVYEATGHLSRTVDLKGERGGRDSFFMERDRLYVVHRDTMAVVAHRVPRLGQ